MSHIVKINEYLDERIHFYTDKINIISNEPTDNNHLTYFQRKSVEELECRYQAIIDELNNVVNNVNGV